MADENDPNPPEEPPTLPPEADQPLGDAPAETTPMSAETTPEAASENPAADVEAVDQAWALPETTPSAFSEREAAAQAAAEDAEPPQRAEDIFAAEPEAPPELASPPGEALSQAAEVRQLDAHDTAAPAPIADQQAAGAKALDDSHPVEFDAEPAEFALEPQALPAAPADVRNGDGVLVAASSAPALERASAPDEVSSEAVEAMEFAAEPDELAPERPPPSPPPADVTDGNDVPPVVAAAEIAQLDPSEATPALLDQNEPIPPAHGETNADEEIFVLADDLPAMAQFAPVPPEPGSELVTFGPDEADEEALEPATREAEPEPETVAREDAPEEPEPATTNDAWRAPTRIDELPPNYFRAAGDPEEQAEAPLSFWGRMRGAAANGLQRAREAIEPRLVAFMGDARAFGGEVWRRIRGIKHPRSVREAAVWGGWTAAAFAALLVGFFFFVTWGMPSTDDLWEASNGQSITVLDRNGNVILREGAQNAPPVDFESLPPYVTQAFIAIEDRRFYQHWGVDFEGMMRAGAQNIRAGRVVQGGSTITQQLAKNLFLTNERSWRRKAQEIALAIWLETKFSKEEILALYLSRVYFGAGAYGIEAAAERYFDRPARELTLLQSAMIAGLVKAPSRLNPARQDIEAARARAETVLTEMVSLDFISDSERQAALQEELVISRRNPAGVLGYYRDWIDPLLNEVIGTQRDDFIIETTLDIQAQRAGAEAVETVLAEQGESRRVGQAALVSLDDQGGVIAMVGGRDYDQSQFNRATQAHRQPGSSFKYFIYLAAMENGLTPWSIREDGPITIRQEGQPDWTPGNYEEEYHGPSELGRAFQFSYNMVAIRVAHEVGRLNVIAVAERLGVTSQLHDYPSLALGAQEVTLMEMTQAYGAMASEGFRLAPHGVVRIRRGRDNEIMWSWRQHDRERVIEERPLRYMNYMLNRVVEAGTGTRARMPGRQIGGKTGTGNDYRDAWFIGYTPGIVTGVWVGNDRFTVTARVTGGSLPADIWARFMPTAVRDLPARDLQMPGADDYDVGLPDPETPTLTAVGAPLGNGSAPTLAPDPDSQNRSLDFGPEG